MPEERTERCPYCGQPITRTQLVEIRAKVRREVEAEASAEFQRRERQLETEFEVKLNRELDKRRRTLEREMGQLKKLLQASQKAVEKQRRMLESRQAVAERQLAKARKELEKRAVNLDREAQRKAAELTNREKARSEAAMERERVEFERQKLDWQRKQDAMEKQVSDLKRKVEEETAYALQEYSEDRLVADLRGAFREDHVERLPRGRNVGDVKHGVVYRGEEVGVIIYDVKNVKSWQNAFVDQAKRYRTIHNTPHVVLVSAAFPGKAKNLAVKNGVLIVSPEHAILVAGLLRDSLVAMAKAKLSVQEREVKVAQLYAYLTSDEYRQRAEGIVDGVQKLRELQAKEMESHRRNWKQQDQQHKRIDESIGDVRAQVETILEAEVPPMTVSLRGKKKERPTEAIVVAP